MSSKYWLGSAREPRAYFPDVDLNASVGHHQAHLLSANRYMFCSVVSVLLFFNDDLAVSIGFLFLGFSIGVLFAHTNRMRFQNPSGYLFDFILALFVMFGWVK
jgi:hypothetical protein